MFNPGPGFGRCLPCPMQQNLCVAVDNCIKNIVIGLFILVSGGSSDVQPAEGRCLPGRAQTQQNICLSADTGINNSVEPIGHFKLVLGRSSDV